MRPQSFEALATMLRNSSGLIVGPDKSYLLETRLAPVIKRHNIRDLDALAALLSNPGAAPRALVDEVVDAMTTNESFFFRDDKPFAHFRANALPAMIAARPDGSRLRVWSAAASSGQEAYSLAMIVADMKAQLGRRTVELLGTDISREQLARARDGLYTQFEVQRGLPMTLLVKHFKKEGTQWRISEAMRAMTSFREWNLLADPAPLGKFDIVFCRNVLIYFDQVTKTRVLNHIAKQMAPDGLLYLGGAETVLGLATRFVALPGERGVYTLTNTPQQATASLVNA